MRKKIILRLLLLTAFMALLWSCQQELQQAEQEYDAQLQKNTVEWLSRAQLEKNHPQVLDKINRISPNNASDNNKTYTDTENEFSIDTDEAYVVKDANGTKTYTFKIKRDSEKDEGSLENLILKDIGDGNFFAYFITYDAAALSNSREKPLSSEELSHNISLYAVGKKTSAEIFGKLNSCPMVFYPVGTYVYVSGHQCIEGLHDYGEPCAYLGTSNAATQGGYEVVYNMTVQETPGSCGGASSGGGMGTTPVYGGGGGNINLPELNDPCEKIKNQFNDAKFKEKVVAIDKPEVFNYDHEMGYAAGYPPPNTGVTGTQYQPMENMLGSHHVTLPDGNQYFGFIHSHNNESNGGQPVKIFSPADLATFLTSCVANADAQGNITDAYAMVITSEGNYMLQFTGQSSGFGIGPNTKKFWLSWYEREIGNLILENEMTQPNIEKVFLRFLKEKVKIDGVELYQVEKITGKAKKLSLDQNNNVIPIPCP
ncbi:hypothetical protein NZD88_19100 [Chryseobacterium antibioticum]|uniref:DUF4329 domain-containing protein n=1 Tax=Chryseobacterium pyrolae TaxID=2987481 RepID=A0ABT2IM21_9FLAO|nr:hypothetical protein [Chryseobacterium pyrolae]MCT2409666.1 hypothetical protein [Chryseobacterium pyrolae]